MPNASFYFPYSILILMTNVCCKIKLNNTCCLFKLNDLSLFKVDITENSQSEVKHHFWKTSAVLKYFLWVTSFILATDFVAIFRHIFMPVNEIEQNLKVHVERPSL